MHEAIKEGPNDDLQLGMLLKKKGFKQRMATAVTLLKVEWYPTLSSALKGLEKNTFAGLALSYWHGSVFGWRRASFSGPPIFRQYSVQCRCSGIICHHYRQYLHFVLFHRKEDVCVLPGLFIVFPFTAFVFIYSILRATFLTMKRGGIEWRGTLYSLKDLRNNNNRKD